MSSWNELSTGLLIIRIVIGALMLGHGMQKLLGSFGGPGMARTAAGFDHLGFRPPMLMAYLAALGEAGSGLLLGTGFLMPLGVASLVGVMINAAAVHNPNGLWITKNGIEYTLVLGMIAVGLGFTGAGRFSLDWAFGLDLTGWGWAAGATLAGVVAGIGTLLSRRRTADRQASPLSRHAN